MRKLLLALVWSVASFPSLGADAWLQNASAAESDRFIITAKLTLGYANAQLLIDGKEQIYCAGLDERLGTAEEAWTLVAESTAGPLEPGLAVLALMAGLKAHYPC